MSRKPREVVVFLLDVGKNMQQLCSNGEATYFQSSKECISQIIQRKIFSVSRDELGLIIFGSEKTENPLASKDEYRNIAIVTDNLQYANWDLLKCIHELECSDTYADWLDAIVVAMEFMKDKTAGFQTVYHFKIVLFSNFECFVFDDQVDAITKGLKDSDISFFVIGPDIQKAECQPGKMKSVNQKAGEARIADIVRKVNGVICSFEEAFPELMYFQRKSVKPTPWNTLLTISEKIKIPIQMFKKVTEPSSRKWSSKVVDDDEATVVKERAFVKFDEDRETEVEVPKDEVISAYQFGSTVVPFSDIDKESMRYLTGEKGLYFIGCTRRDKVPLHILIGDGSYVVLTKPEDNVAKVALEAFVQALFDRNCVGIARRIYNRNTSTTMGALFPIVTEESRYLVFAQLPFAEDEHLYKFPSLADIKTTYEQNKAVDDLIDQMDLDATGVEPEKYDITKIYDHNEQFIFRGLSFKALFPDQTLPDELTEKGLNALKADPVMLETCQSQFEQIKNLFPLEEVPEKPKRKAFRKRRLDQDDDDAPVSTSLFKTSLASSSVDRNQDFLSSLRQHLPASEIQPIQSDVNEIVGASYADPTKTLATLRTLCKICSSFPKVYNEWVASLKEHFDRTNNSQIWEKIVEEKLNSIDEHTSNNNAASKTPEVPNNEADDADSQYGTQTSDCIDDLLDNI